MKLFDYKMAPNPRRVRMFAAEKGIELEVVSVDLGRREQMEDAFKSVNPRLCVPAFRWNKGSRNSVRRCRGNSVVWPASFRARRR